MPTSFFSRILNLIAPRACHVCGHRLNIQEDCICTACNLHLPRTNYALSPTDNMMARRLWGHVPVERCAALFHYEPHSQTANILYDLKYHQHPEIGRAMGEMIAEEFSGLGFFLGIDAIIPVPLTKSRQRERGYNQSHEIAKGVNAITRLPIVDKAVIRETFNESQTRKNALERRENVEKAFRLIGPESIEDRHLLLIDDVLTTGATITACAKELLKAPNVTISVLTLAVAKE